MFLTWALPKRPIFEEFTNAWKCHAIIITPFHLKFRELSILFCFFSSFFFRSISTNKGKKNDVYCNIPALELKSRSQTVYAFFCSRSRRASNASPEATSSQKKGTHFDCDSTTSCDIIIIECTRTAPGPAY